LLRALSYMVVSACLAVEGMLNFVVICWESLRVFLD